MEWFKLFFGFLGQISWPLIVLFIVWKYKDQVQTLFSRMTKLSKGGAEFAYDQSSAPSIENLGEISEKKEIAEVISSTASDEDIDEARNSAVSNEKTNLQNAIEGSLMRDLERIPESERLKVLVHELSNTRITAAFERIYALIFGSQLMALMRLKHYKGTVSLEDAKQFFNENFKPENPEINSKINFEVWFKFLTDQDLIKIVDQNIDLTDFGMEFLKYVERWKVNQHRLL